MSSAHRIDVHQHVVPPFYAQALASHGGDPSGSVTPEWSPERALDFMDSQQIATGILSVSTPSVVGWAPERAAGDGTSHQRIHRRSGRRPARQVRQLRDAAAS